jgi:hypothetical protein
MQRVKENYVTLLQGPWITEASTLAWMLEKKLLHKPACCPHCPVGQVQQVQGQAKWRCSGPGACAKRWSMYKETMFQNCKMPKSRVLGLLYLLTMGVSHQAIMDLTNLTFDSLSRWSEYHADLLAWDLNHRPMLDGATGQIGGPGIVVEVDESKFGKRKHHRGHPVEGVWVIGGVERGGDRGVFLAQVPDRSAETLMAVIEHHVAAGTTVYSDCWKGYRKEDLQAIGILHETVNHSKFFKDPVTGVHTNTIEGTWSAVKRAIPVRHRTTALIDKGLITFIWNRKHRGPHKWAAFLDALGRCSFPDIQYIAPAKKQGTQYWVSLVVAYLLALFFFYYMRIEMLK